MDMANEDKEVVLDRLARTISIFNDSQAGSTINRYGFHGLLVAKDSKIRTCAVKWIINVCLIASLSKDTRDTGIQIFDRFMSLVAAENALLIVNDTEFVSIASACAIILSSKMHDFMPLKMSTFVHFTMDDLVRFEHIVLTKLQYFIVPLSSPVSFIRHLLSLGLDNQCAREVELYLAADFIVELFWEENESVLYSPAVIAFAAIIIAFAKQNLDCSAWLEKLPDEVFTCIETSILDFPMFEATRCANENPFERVLANVETCIRSMRKNPEIGEELKSAQLSTACASQLCQWPSADSQDFGIEVKGESPPDNVNRVSPTGVAGILEESDDYSELNFMCLTSESKKNESKLLSTCSVFYPISLEDSNVTELQEQISDGYVLQSSEFTVCKRKRIRRSEASSDLTELCAENLSSKKRNLRK